MLVESLDLDVKIKNLIIKKDGIKELYPPQSEAIEKGLLSGKNLVISIPTAAGKTLLAEFAALKHVVEQGGKAIYLCPLRALASEKFNALKRFESLGVRVTVTSGDYNSSDSYLPKFDIIVSTNEKMDALLRHKASWIKDQVSLVIIDECHLLNDQHRGPTLEILLARLLIENTQSQILALSATIGNADELAEWLDAELVQSDWRPVPLKEGIYFDDRVTYSDYSSREIPFRRKDQLVNIALDSIHSQEQILIFTPSRRSAVSTAERIGKSTESLIEPREVKYLDDLASKIVLNISDPLSLKLAETIKRGATFHHAGLNSRQRELVETAFRKGYIKILCATPTLCISRDTMIWHDVSETRVSDYNLDQPLFSLKENYLTQNHPDEVIVFENNSNLLQIDSVSGYSIKVTPNHKFLVRRNGQKLIIRAGMIKKSDRIATIGNLNLHDGSSCKIKDFIVDNRIDLENFDFDNDLMYFLGLMLGDGYSGAETRNNKIIYKGSPTIVNNEEKIINHCQKICIKLGVYYKTRKDHYGTPTLVFSKKKWFREFLVRCGVEIGEKKYIPKKIMKSSKSNISSLLRGLFDSDGYVNKRRSVGFSNTSRLLIKQVQKALLRFGIVCRLRKREGKSMKIYEKEYRTKCHYELTISHKECILEFNKSIGFNLRKKQRDLNNLVFLIKKNIHFVSCMKCKFKIFHDLFSGRTKTQKRWGKQKLEVIRCLGKKRELGSNELKNILCFPPRKKEIRLNHHYELIKKRKIGSISNNEWFWSLNQIGDWIYKNLLCSNKSDFNNFFILKSCPICNTALEYKLKKGWRSEDFDGDIYFDIIRNIEEVKKEPWVYDVVLPNKPLNDHMYVANGFIIHNSAGINLPAKRVIVSSVYRYSIEEGSHPIKTLECKQMLGRAGRPQFDTEGEAILLAKKAETVNWLMDRYIHRDPEAMYSKLAAKPALRRAILGLIASKVVSTVSDLLQFFEKTFYGFQFEAVFLEGKIREVIDLLIGWKMIDPLDANETLTATLYGLRVSHLYLDPETAATIADGLAKAIQQSRSKIHPVALLDLMMGTPDMVTLSFRKSHWKITEKRMERFTSRLIRKVPEPYDIEFEFRLRDFHTVLFLWDWIKELPIELLIIRYKIGSGDVQRIVETATWIMSATAEIAHLKARNNKNYHIFMKAAQSLSDRVKYGIKNDAVSLTRIKGIGRKRARVLLDHGIRDITKILTLSVSDLSQIPGFGSELAKSFLESAKKLTEPTKEENGFNVDLENYLL
ncbi:MAG: DEAD/DEAH box helicase [Candidatus Hodarchaeales archaeon]|jgi:helicase